MAKFAQHDAVVKFDNASDTLQDVSTSIQSVTMDMTVNGGQFHTLGDRWADSLEGGIMGTVTVNFYDDTSATSFAGYMREWLLHASNKAGVRSMQIQKPDGTSGSTQFDFEVRAGGSVQLVNATAGAGDPQTLTVTLNIDGPVTETTIA